MPSDKKLFPSSKHKRENGTGIDMGYSLTWRGCEWHPLIAPSPNLQKALSSGPSLSIAQDLHPGPGFFELAIAPKDKTSKRVEVYIEASENLRDAVVALIDIKCKYKGFFDHALKENHCVWIRYKTTSSYENSKREVNKILDKYDYAWVQQNYGSARTLALKPRLFCGCCCRTGWDIIEGAPKFSKNESSFKKLMSRK
jgi:hypothetical protein